MRSALQSAGYNPSSIGYSNGTVTLNNQPFVTPSANVNGTTYANQSVYNNALANTRIGDLQNQIVNNTKLPDNPYSSQIDDTIKYLMDYAKNQQVSDPRSTPEYEAYKAQADKQAQAGIRAAQESMGSSGFGRSTALGERAQGIQNDATAYLETQVIPQILAAERERQQQQYNNVMSILNPLMSQQQYADTRSQTELGNVYNALNSVTGEQQRGYDNARADAALTGNYLTPDQQTAINTLLGLKQQAETKGITKEQRDALSAQADTVRNQMRAMGLDPTQFGANVSYNSASQVNPGRTLQGQQLDMQKSQQQLDQQQREWDNNFNLEQFAYQKARDAITDQKWQAEFDENKRQYGLDYALKELAQNDQKSYQDAMLAINQSSNDLDWEKYKSSLTQGTQPVTAEDYATSYLDKAAKYDPDDGSLLNADAIEKQILTAPLSEYDQYKLYQRYGLPWDGPAPSPTSGK
ncbi:hypothetical protein CJP46_35310 [Paenibacillus sp. XY044]|nr:hypothetical protein CJP46_35310 [Paenibacillus sp. XY044]